MFPDSAVPLPPNWTGPVFHLSQSYPNQIASDTYPWMNYDPTTQPDQYLAAVLKYCLEGNSDNDWVLQKSDVRGWYHAPWMHWGAHGREPIHGLTFDRMSQPGELAPQQTAGRILYRHEPRNSRDARSDHRQTLPQLSRPCGRASGTWRFDLRGIPPERR